MEEMRRAELRAGAAAICGGRQTCGKCQIVVEEGRFPKHALISAAGHVTPVGDREAQYSAANPLDGRRLACACEVRGDLLITVPEESQAKPVKARGVERGHACRETDPDQSLDAGDLVLPRDIKILIHGQQRCAPPASSSLLEVARTA